MDDPAIAIFVVFGVLILLLVAGAPTFIAFRRKHHYRWVIFAINVLFGATGIGYLIALVWAVWPRQTAVTDLLLNDLTANSRDGNRAIYTRYGQNLQALNQAREEATIYVHSNGQSHGPYNPAEIRALLQDGKISSSDLAWKEGMEAWVPVLDIARVPVRLAVPVRA